MTPIETLPASDDALFDASVAAIESEYVRLGHRLGWRFIYGPRAVLRDRVDVALVTLNPGGDLAPDGHPRTSCERGVAFVAERWGGALPGRSTLQLQVQGLFRELAAQPGCVGDWRSLIERSALGSLVPFRSSTFARLVAPRQSIAFGQRLWRGLLPRLSPRLVVVLGREAQREMQSLIPEALGLRSTTRVALPTGWGNFDAEVDTFGHGTRRTRLLYLPHLSRFTLFTSVRCRPFVERIVAEAAHDLWSTQRAAA